MITSARHFTFPGDRIEDYATTWRACYGWLIIGDYAAALVDWLGMDPVSAETRERWFRLGAAVDYLDDVLDEGSPAKAGDRLGRFLRLLDPTVTGEELEEDARVSVANLWKAYHGLPVAHWERLESAAKVIGVIAGFKRSVSTPRRYVRLLTSESLLTTHLFLSALTAGEAHRLGGRFVVSLRRLTAAGVFYDHARDLRDDAAAERIPAGLATRRTALRLYATCAWHLTCLLARPRVARGLLHLAFNRGVLRGLLGRDKLVGLDGIALAMLDEQDKALS